MAETIKPVNEKKLICVLCGREWVPSIENLCECGGFWHLVPKEFKK